MERSPATARLRAAIATAVAAVLVLALASPALAVSTQLKEEFAVFKDCPTSTAALCTVASTTSGEFQMGNKNVPISKTLTLQGGLSSTNAFSTQPLIAAKDGNTLPAVPLTVPGGLLGIEGLGGEVTATAELAGPTSGIQIDQYSLLGGTGTAVTLPLKVKLSNPILGDECYIGSDSEPILLDLTSGTTSPPSPNKPISGNPGTVTTPGKKKITAVNGNTLVDNSFAVPAAKNCGTTGLQWLITPIVDLDIGLPAAAGHNTAIMSGSFEKTEAQWVLKFEKEKKAKK